MQPLSAILDACTVAIRRMTVEPECDWHSHYCAVVDPASVLEMAIIIRNLLRYIDAKDDGSIVAELVKTRISGNTGPYAGQAEESINK